MSTIRRMTVEDFAAVYRLGTVCFDVLEKPYNWWSLSEVADHLENHPAGCFVAEAEGRLAGFALCSAPFELINDHAHLEWIAVDSAFRGRGIAAQLIDHCVEHYRAAGFKGIVADVSSANSASRRLFGGRGFSEGISVTFFTREL